MTFGTPQELSELYFKHKKSITLLRKFAEKDFPKLKATSADSPQSLKDGTVVDDLFYLRYVLSSKEPLDTEEQVRSSKALKGLRENVNWRTSNPNITVDQAKENELLKLIPLLRTGELENGFPVVFLPVNEVDFKVVSKKQGDKAFENDVFDFLLTLKNSIFKEIDQKTRESGLLTKSVTVYDLSGLGYSSLYKLSKFFKLTQGQGKKFKQYFPQSSHSTVILNSPGAWVLKLFSGSSKQKIMGVKDFLKSYQAADAVPDLVGGNLSWHKCKSEKIGSGDDLDALGVVELVSIAPPPAASDDAMSVRDSSDVHSVVPSGNMEQPRRKLNRKMSLTELERELIHMKKNKLFSIAVLDKNQKVEMVIKNARGKAAHVYVAVKEEIEGKVSESGEKAYKTNKVTAKIRPGGQRMTVKLQNPGEVLLVYLDKKRVKDSDSSSLETMNLRKSAAKRALKFGKKLSRKLLAGNNKSTVTIKKMKKLQKNRDPVYIPTLARAEEEALRGKVYFRFEVTDSVICGQYDGSQNVPDSELEGATNLAKFASSSHSLSQTITDNNLKLNAEGLIDYDDTQSLASTYSGLSLLSSVEIEKMLKKKEEEASFLRAAAEIFKMKW